jgi:NADPH:quinone reductase-like Zn-dependent oxidoreductase
MTMTRVVVTAFGGPEVLRLIEKDLPQPRAGEVRVKVLAAGVAFADILFRRGLLRGVQSLPFTPGFDVVGIVDQVGEGVSTVKEGETVAALTETGGYAQFVVLPERELVPVPPQLDQAEAVSLVLNYTTAFQLLHRVGHAHPGQRLLVHGAGGGVGTAALQLGALSRLEMYGTASSPKHQLVRELGAVPIDYKTEDVVARVRTLTGAGVDLVLDPVGGPNFRRSYQVLSRGGRLLGYGFSAALKNGRLSRLRIVSSLARFAALKCLPDGRSASWYSMTAMKRQHPQWFREDLQGLLKLAAERRLRPIVAERLPLAEAARAHRMLEEGAVLGKLVLLPQAS